MNDSIFLFGIRIDRINRKFAVEKISEWLHAEEKPCKYVVTPNVDHIVRLDTSTEFKNTYEHASLVLTDGRPLILASRLLGSPLPETVPGSDLVPLLFTHIAETWNRPVGVFLLGAGPGIAERAEDRIQKTWSNVKIVGTYSPPFGFEQNAKECTEICDRISHVNTELLVIGLGSPKQELWIEKYAPLLPVKVALCVGATIDFLAGEKKRAPKWIQSIGLEWLHRMLSEPRRLAGRYAKDAIIFPRLFFREWKLSRKSSNIARL
ncbi:N-acetylglucosaminyldiphosphoundecaprenol N-acetyl-beta-D-mannosaminyltransferase [Gammaproteobacteria bacterium]